MRAKRKRSLSDRKKDGFVNHGGQAEFERKVELVSSLSSFLASFLPERISIVCICYTHFDIWKCNNRHAVDLQFYKHNYIHVV